MKVYHYGLQYDKQERNIALVTCRVFTEPDASYSPQWLCDFLYSRIHLKKARLDRDILASLDGKRRVSAVFNIQNGAGTYMLFSRRLALLYALLSFREAFVFVHYKANASCLPVKRDLSAWHNLKESFRLLSLTLHDFLLTGPDGFYSFKSQDKPRQPVPAAAISQTNGRAA